MTTIGNRIEIQLSKTKLILLIVGSLIFISIGLYILIFNPSIKHTFLANPTNLKIAAYSSIIFFGICLIAIVRKLFDNRPGVVIDEIGINDNSSGVSGGQILWSDIINISEFKMSTSLFNFNNQKFLLIHVNNPSDYINKQTNNFKKKLMTINYNHFGSPLSLTSNGLKISYDQLHKLIKDNFEIYRQKSPNY